MVHIFRTRDCCVVETCEILLPVFIFLKEAFYVAKKYFCYSTVNIHIIRPNDRKPHARCKSGRSGHNA